LQHPIFRELSPKIVRIFFWIEKFPLIGYRTLQPWSLDSPTTSDFYEL
jgi:hypothetical protein